MSTCHSKSGTDLPTHRFEVDLERLLDENGGKELEADRVVTLPQTLPRKKSDNTEISFETKRRAGFMLGV